MKKLLLVPAVVGVLGVVPLVAHATPVGPIVIGTEDGSTGFFGPIPGSAVTVGSDGEVPFDPFSAGFDTSDGIQAPGGLFPVPGTTTPYWQQLTAGPFAGAWVLPADLTPFGLGAENEPDLEPIGEWFLAPGILPVGQWSILESDGGFSDLITYDGTILTFQSDPVPEPASMGILFGAGALSLLRRGRRH